jgi:hypothetical protein
VFCYNLFMPSGKNHDEVASRPAVKVFTWMIFLASSILYLLSTSHVHTYDGLQYALSVESGRLVELLHPHHLLYNVLAYLLWKPLTLLFADLRSITIMGLISALAAAGGLSLMWRFWRRSNVPWLPSLAGIVWLGLSYGYWSYAAEVEVYLPACFFMALALDRAVLVEKSARGRYVWQLGLTIALMLLFTQSAAIYWVGFALWMWKQREGRWPRLVRYSIASILPVLIVYLAAAWLVAGFSPGAIYSWLTAYAQMGQWGHWLPGWFATSVAGIVTTMMVIPPFATNPAIIQAMAGPQWIAWVYLGGLGLLVAAAVWGWSLQLHGWRGAIVPLWLLIVAHFIFFAWWQPENTEFWIIFMLLLATTAVWGFSRLPHIWRNITASLMLSLGVAGGIVNYMFFIGPRTNQENDLDLKAVQQISRVVHCDDYFLLPQNTFEKSLHYWGGFQNAINLSELSMGDEHPDWFKALQSLKAWQNKAAEKNQKIYILGSIMLESNLLVDARNGDESAQMVYTMLTSQASHVMDVVTSENSFELTILDKEKSPSLRLDMVQLKWPPDTAQPLDDGVGFFSNFSAPQPVNIPKRGQYRIEVRGRGSSFGGQGAILVLRMDDTLIGQLEFGEANWTTKSLLPMEFTDGRHVLILDYVNDIYDDASGKGRDLFLSTIQFVPLETQP